MSKRSGGGRSTCSSGKSVLAACTLVQNIQHSRAEVRASLFQPIEKVPKASPLNHSICPAHTARSRCFVAVFHQSPRRHRELFGLGLRRIQCCDRFGVLAVLHCGVRFPQQTWRFPRIDSRSIEASSAPTRRGVACARGCRPSGHTSRSARILSTVAAGRGILKKRSATARAGGCQTCRRSYIRGSAFPRFRFNERVRPKEVRTPDPNGHFELGGTLATRGSVRQACRVRNGRLLRLHNINQTGGSL